MGKTLPVLLVCSLCVLAAFGKQFSVLCSKNGEVYSCNVNPFGQKPWSARATLFENLNTTGWDRLIVEANGDVTSDLGLYGSGFIEGYMTQEIIDLTWLNGEQSPSKKAADFVNEMMAWMQSMVTQHAQTDTYWQQVGYVLLQQAGLYDGYARASSPALTRNQLLYLGMTVELGDIEQAVDASARIDYSSLSDEEYFKLIAQTHCSAIFRVTADLSDIYASHDTWSAYATMLRLFKSYATVSGAANSTKASPTADIHFSGYPGMLASVDDFYLTSQRIVVTETTNSIFNGSLYSLIKPQSVPYWVRVTVASRLATTAPQWHELFYRFNSGTYSNQWMTLDYKLFVPGHPLPPGTFWVSEQLPGMFESADQTMALQRGHWPSYNVPFYESIYDISGYPAQVAQRGPASSYQMAPRASLMRRGVGSAVDQHTLEELMQQNTFGTGDPLAKSPFDAIAARGDLYPSSPVPFGAIDSKVTTLALASAMAVRAISGPTHLGHPPFQWGSTWGSSPHFGQPPLFNFDWQTYSYPNGTLG